MKEIKDLFDYLESIKEDTIWTKKVTAYGYQFNYDTVIYSSVSKYGFFPLTITDYETPLTNENRPGTIKKSIEYVCVHDTASSAESAGALAHAKYVFNGGGGTSWHYSVGDDAIYRQIPDNEVAYHAGDGTLQGFALKKTGVKGDKKNPKVSIKGNYYYIDGKKSNIEIPKISYKLTEDGFFAWVCDGIEGQKMRYNREFVTDEEIAKEKISRIVLDDDHINDQGLFVCSIDNEYYMSNTYYNTGYDLLANRGGNLNSIGMETMINQGSDLYLTWHQTAKLCAYLLDKYNLTIDRVKPHHFFSGKPCPQTL